MNREAPTALISLSSSVFTDEDEAVAYFTGVRWKNGPYCPYCAARHIYHFADRRTHRCADCRRKFSIRAGTIFEDSRLALHQWLHAVHIVTSSDGMVTSTELARTLDVTQKTAWLMLQRFRQAAITNSFNGRDTLSPASDRNLLL